MVVHICNINSCAKFGGGGDILQVGEVISKHLVQNAYGIQQEISLHLEK